MGKVLVIKNVNFEKNSLGKIKFANWYINREATMSESSNISDPLYAPFSYFNAEALLNKPVNVIKVRPAVAGKFSIFKLPKLGQSGSVVATLNFTSNMIGVPTVFTFDEVTLSGTEVLAFNSGSDNGKIYYNTISELAGGDFYTKADNDAIPQRNQDLCISIGYIQE